MYQTVTLEKGMYHLTGKSFLQALEAQDPSEQYADTPLSGLDAYERQLKRFDIRVSGPDCDRVEKFFTTTESAVLFPEFVRRAVKQGMEDSILSELTAVHTRIDGTSYKGLSIDDNDTAYTTTHAQGADLSQTSITEDADSISIDKYGRLITASYELVRQQRLDVFALALRSVGMKLAGAVTAAALNALAADTADIGLSDAASGLTYGDLGRLYGTLTDFHMTTLVASPAAMTAILGLDELGDGCTGDGCAVKLPFGTTLLKSSQLSGNTLIGFDRRFALEMITGSDVVLETDKLIGCQLDCIAVTISAGFKKLHGDAVTMLSYT